MILTNQWLEIGFASFQTMREILQRRLSSLSR